MSAVLPDWSTSLDTCLKRFYHCVAYKVNYTVNKVSKKTRCHIEVSSADSQYFGKLIKALLGVGQITKMRRYKSGIIKITIQPIDT